MVVAVIIRQSLFIIFLSLILSIQLFSFSERRIKKYTDMIKDDEERAKVLVTYLYDFPKNEIVNRQFPQDDREFLLMIASDTFKFFINIVDRNTHLPLDTIQVGPKKFVGDYTNITNIGLYFLSIVSGYDLGLISKDEAISRIKKTLSIVETREMFQGFHFNYYDTTTMERTTHFVSFVDSGWYIWGLIVVAETFPEFKPKVEKILKRSNFKFFYDEKEGLMYHGYNVKEQKYSDYHYGMLNTEARTISLLAIAKGDVPLKHWFKIHRVLPKNWSWQKQRPKGGNKFYYVAKISGEEHILNKKNLLLKIGLIKPDKIKVFEGYYEYEELKVVPSWGGSMFEALMPLMVIDEQNWAKKSFAINNKNYVLAHIKYAQKKNYPVWGMSPCSLPDRYGEFGVPEIGAKGYNDGVVTPHASFLALMVLPEEAIKNLRKMLEVYPGIYGEYGFYDSVNLETGEVTKKYLLLDQAMSFIAINNYLNNNIIPRRISKSKFGKKIKKILEMEEFYVEQN
ncbi:MAG: hypothetical protein NZ928_02285 [Endomicrobia bacterium]|nr:hypothetical protein [Endomicrobiia bacterium]MDW8055788.1 glucoamylase family protein [Elusimicrobiota bacterium]